MTVVKNELSGVSAALPRTAGNENTGLIKLIAILCMMVDHVGAAFFPRVYELRFIGRISFPLFAWCLCVGSEYTRNVWKYALRLLIVGIVSQPVYAWAMNHRWYELNVFFELFIGLLAITAVKENRKGSRYWGPVLAVLAACIVNVKHNYGWQGILLILLLYACRKRRTALAGGFALFCLYWGQGSMRLIQFLGVTLPTELSFLPYGAGLLSDLSRLQFWGILALPLFVFPMGRRLRLPQWVSYAAYPGHLLVIGMIRHWETLSQWL